MCRLQGRSHADNRTSGRSSRKQVYDQTCSPGRTSYFQGETKRQSWTHKTSFFLHWWLLFCRETSHTANSYTSLKRKAHTSDSWVCSYSCYFSTSIFLGGSFLVVISHFSLVMRSRLVPELPVEPTEIKLSHVEGGSDASGNNTKERLNEHIY